MFITSLLMRMLLLTFISSLKIVLVTGNRVEPVKKLAFIKTHKTGGSTLHVKVALEYKKTTFWLQNIFIRYGLSYNLSVGFPSTRENSYFFLTNRHYE